jgi:hypothetical protein
LAKNFFDIFKEKPIAIKWTIAPTIAAWIRSPKIIQDKKNAKRDGIITNIAISEPFRMISFMVSLDVFFSLDTNRP